MNDHFCVILARPFAAENIGAVARAMKNMGCNRLRLVSPRPRWKAKAYRLARSASDLLDQAEVFSDIQSAVRDLNYVVGTTARSGHHRGQFVDFDEAVLNMKQSSAQKRVGLMFGRESKGLNNEETGVCDHLMSIPSHSSYTSLNLAQAVIVTLFSMVQTDLKKSQKKPSNKGATRYVTKEESENAFKHFEKALESLGFSEGPHGKIVRVRKLMEIIFKRAGMQARDAQMLMGLSSQINKCVSQKRA